MFDVRSTHIEGLRCFHVSVQYADDEQHHHFHFNVRDDIDMDDFCNAITQAINNIAKRVH